MPARSMAAVSAPPKPLVAVNCAAFTETLLESEPFGHERGAFTGVEHARVGLFEAAHEGTLFLDEAGEMSMAAQAKLLRVLTDGQVMRIGSTKPRPVDQGTGDGIFALFGAPFTHRTFAADAMPNILYADLAK